MEKWAERILEQMAAKDLNVPGLAKACGRSQPSVWQWFNDSDSKPATKMIMADNAVAAARYLGTTVEYLMTGHGLEQGSSQPVGLDVERLTMLMEEVERAAAGLVKLSSRSKAAIINALYMDAHVTPEMAAVAARAALNGILASEKGSREPATSG